MGWKFNSWWRFPPMLLLLGSVLFSCTGSNNQTGDISLSLHEVFQNDFALMMIYEAHIELSARTKVKPESPPSIDSSLALLLGVDSSETGHNEDSAGGIENAEIRYMDDPLLFGKFHPQVNVDFFLAKTTSVTSGYALAEDTQLINSFLEDETLFGEASGVMQPLWFNSYFEGKIDSSYYALALLKKNEQALTFDIKDIKKFVILNPANDGSFLFPIKKIFKKEEPMNVWIVFHPYLTNSFRKAKNPYDYRLILLTINQKHYYGSVSLDTIGPAVSLGRVSSELVVELKKCCANLIDE